MTELRGTFDAAKADWDKLFGETPKSIDDIDVIGLHDKTIDKKREFVAIDRVLEIIDKETDYIDSKYVYDEEITYQEYARHFTSIIRAILALKGGEKE